MKRTARVEIQQSKPFPSLAEEVHVEVLLTAQATNWVAMMALKPSGLSPTQFNVLRILRGARPDALPAGRIADRMVTRDPDLTRLLDRLEAQGLVEKSRDAEDRRVVNVRITKAGLARLVPASKAINQALKAALNPLGVRKLERLANLLDQARVSVRQHSQEHSD
jgi:DNA-binding MarR family transcriptional regulator